MTDTQHLIGNGVGDIDVILVSWRDFSGFLTRLLVSVRYGINFKRAWSHVAIRMGDKIFSAGTTGVKILSGDYYAVNAIEHDIWRLTVPSVAYDRAYKVALGLVGVGYAFPRYVLDALRIIAFLLVFAGLVVSPLWMLHIIGLSLPAWLIGVGLAIYGGSQFLLHGDRTTVDCSETSGLILQAAGSIVPFGGDCRNLFPDWFDGTLRTMAIYNGCKILPEEGAKCPGQ
jgi:hypothetical protein